jgi:hypothetical protein
MGLRVLLRYGYAGLFALLLGPSSVWAQGAAPHSNNEERLQLQIDDLQAQVQQMKSELDELRRRDATKAPDEAPTKLATNSAHVDVRKPEGQPANPDSPVIESLLEDLDLLNKKIEDEYQTKVESSSRYRVRLSGMFLVNFFCNRGVGDNIENPTLPLVPAVDQSNGNFGGTIRQTQLGLEVVGPDVLGARTSGNVQMDFAGGFADTPSGSTVGLPRLRTGTVRLDWKKTSLVAGQDGLFFSPVSPTSFASLEQSPLANSGNLWGWAPQIRIEHRFSAFAGSQIIVDTGILDPISGELPTDGNNRDFGVGEASLQPALATHIGWSKSVFHKPLTIGVGGFRGRQIWQASATGTHMTSWLVSTDWEIPTTRWTSISGSFYRGKSIGVFGGGIGQSAVVTDTSAAVDGFPVQHYSGLDSIGGWAQLKVQPFRKIEFNTAFGQDNPFASELRSATTVSYARASLLRNRTIFSNVIYRPRSNLLFSLELRHIRGVQQLDEASESANHINMAMGILF